MTFAVRPARAIATGSAIWSSHGRRCWTALFASIASAVSIHSRAKSEPVGKPTTPALK